MTRRREIIRYNNICKDRYQLYSVRLGDAEIETVVTHDAWTVEKWINNTFEANKCRLDRLIVGLDTEWTLTPDQSVAVVQLCVGNTCLIYQIIQINQGAAEAVPDCLRDFFANPNFTFVGVGVEEDVKKLRRDYGLIVEKTRDLRPWAAEELGRKELRRAGLKSLVEELIGEEMDKPKHVTLSRWDNCILTQPQVLYACGDAYFSFELGRRLSAWYPS